MIRARFVSISPLAIESFRSSLYFEFCMNFQT